MGQSGAQAFYEPIPRRFPFEYVSISRVRAEGVTSTQVDDARLKRLIRQAGRTINQVTGQWFLPIESTERMSGRGGPAVHHDSLIPILEVGTIQVDRSGDVLSGLGIPDIGGGSLTNIESSNVRIDDRELHLTVFHKRMVGGRWSGRPARWPRGSRNIVVPGTFGWLEERPFSNTGERSRSTTTTAAITSTTTSISVESTDGFRPDDTVIIRSGAAYENFGTHAIINSIVESPASLEIDAPAHLRDSIASGANVITYGRVPFEVEKAAILLVVNNKNAFGSSAAQAASADRIKRERTDNYEYELFPQTTGTEGSSGTSTGVAAADRILKHYVAPPYLGAV